MAESRCERSAVGVVTPKALVPSGLRSQTCNSTRVKIAWDLGGVGSGVPDEVGGATDVVLGVILAVAWAVVILAALLRWRDERRLGDTVVDFHRQLRVLRRSASRRHERLLARSGRQALRVTAPLARPRAAALAFSTSDPGETARVRLDQVAEGQMAHWVFPDEKVADGVPARRTEAVARAATRALDVDAPGARRRLTEPGDVERVSPGSTEALASAGSSGEWTALHPEASPGIARRATGSGGAGVRADDGVRRARQRPSAGRSRPRPPRSRAAEMPARRRTLRHRRGRMLIVLVVATIGSLVVAGLLGPRWVFALTAVFLSLSAVYVVLLRRLRPVRPAAVRDRGTAHRASAPHALSGSASGIRDPEPQRIPIERGLEVAARPPVARRAQR